LFEAVLGEVLVQTGVGTLYLGRKARRGPIWDDQDLLTDVDKFCEGEV
jgi:hypothetical protein